MSYKDKERKYKDRETRIISIMNQKGGVGKSTTAINLSACIGAKGPKVLILDFDPQGNSTSGLGIDKEELESDVYNALIEGGKLSDIILETPAKNVFIVPSTIQLAGAEIELVSIQSRENILKSLINEVKDDFDFIFIDCPPSLGLLTINALVASDSILIPIQCEYYALEGVTKLLESMKMIKSKLNPELEIFGVLLTMFDARTTLANQVAYEVRSYFGDKVFKTLIPRSVKLSEAPSHGIPINMYAKLNKGAFAYANLAKEVMKRA